MKVLLVVLAAIVVILSPATGLAQKLVIIEGGEVLPELNLPEKPSEPPTKEPRVTVDINYVVGEHQKVFVYEPFVKDGKLYNIDGIDFTIKLRLDEMGSIGYRSERVGLSNAFNTLEGADYERRVRRDIVFHDGSAKYRELFGSLKLPKSYGHSLVIGFAKSVFERSWQYGFVVNNREDSFTGLVLGGEGRQKVGKLSFNYSGRWYPRPYEKVSSSSASDEGFQSSGYELRGMATWAITKHLGLTGGYEFRRFMTDRRGSWLPMSEEQTVKGFLVGTRLSF